MTDCPDCAEHPAGICFACKMTYWRARGAPGVVVPKAFRRESTNRELEKEIIDGAKAQGREIQRADTVWT